MTHTSSKKEEQLEKELAIRNLLAQWHSEDDIVAYFFWGESEGELRELIREVKKKAMTPTEQDKELREKLYKIFPCDCSFIKGFAFKPGDPCDGSCVNAPYRRAVLQLITADRKRVALEARIDENESWHALGRMIDPREFVAEIGRLELKKQEEV